MDMAAALGWHSVDFQRVAAKLQVCPTDLMFVLYLQNAARVDYPLTQLPSGRRNYRYAHARRELQVDGMEDMASILIGWVTTNAVSEETRKRRYISDTDLGPHDDIIGLHSDIISSICK